MLGFVVAGALLVAGAVLLTVGAEAFAEHAGAASARLGVSVFALALLLAGAEPEEAVTAMVASGQSHPALAAGDAIGANLVILSLTLGLAALVTPLPVSRRVAEYAAASAVLGAVAVALAWNGVLGRWDGLILVVLYAGGVGWVWRREHEPPAVGELAEMELDDDHAHQVHDQVHDQERNRTGEDTGRPLLLVLLGVLGMVAGGYLAVRGAEGLVGLFHADESVIGLTVLALATSAEMLALVFAAARRGTSEIVVAGTVGSVGYNATVTLGLAALVNPLLIGRHNPVLLVGVLVAVLPLVLLLGLRTGALPRLLGLPLVAVYVLVVWRLFAG